MNFERLCIGCMREKKENEKICPYCGCDEEAYVVPKQALQPFTILNGKYLLGRVLGIGGFGIAYIAVDIPLERRIAIKEFFPAGSAYREEETTVTLGGISEAQEKMVKVTREKFAAEARMLAQLETMDGIVKVYDFFEENRTAYIVMEYLDGITLKDYVKGKNKLSWKETLTKIRPVLHSLEILHENGILHRDISPDNIMVLKDESLKLFDFGGAKDQAAQQGVSVVAFKKAGYSPIEQYQVDGELGAWSDEYALAATMYYCICGHAPAEASSRVLDSSNLKTPHQEGIELPKEAEKALLKGLSIRATDRYPSLKEFEAALYETKRLDQDWIKKAAVIGIGVLVVAGTGVCAGQLMSGNKAVNTVENKTEEQQTEEQQTEEQQTEEQQTIEELLSEGMQSLETGEYKEAAANFQIAADRGSAMAQYQLGVCYKTGAGVTKDEKKAAEYFKKATEGLKTEAEQGDVDAQLTLGGMYSVGDGVEQNTDEAIKWWEKAAYQGNAIARFNLGGAYLYGDGVEQNSSKAAMWFARAAMQGDSYSQCKLGKMYLEGNGIKKDEEIGKAWLQKAADQGDEEAQELLENLMASETEKQTETETEEQKTTTYSITVSGGSGSGEYAEKNTVAIKAEDRTAEGYEFVSWKTVAGNVQIENSSSEETTIVVQNQNATIGASYQKTEEKLLSEGKESFEKKKYKEAIANFRAAANRGNSEAQYWLAVCYESGDGVAEDDEKAVEYYEKAAEAGYADAQFRLGLVYEIGEKGVKQDPAKATEWYQRAAYQGNKGAQYMLAQCYLQGNGVEQNSLKAAEWFEKGAMQGHSYSQYELGKMYIEGNGIKKNEEKGKVWLQKAADQGADEAKELLDSLMVAETETEKETETERQPETEEQKTIEELSSDGYESYWNEDYEEAVKNFQEAADRGDADAQEMLAICYEYGRGIAQDDEQATMWYQKAAEQYQKAAEEGDAEAEYDIGRLCMFGEGVEQDSAKAVEWFQKAADQGHEVAPYYLANCYLYGDGVEKNTEKAAEWLEKLAVEGWSDSQYMLGKLYIEGDGVEKDEEKGKAWLQKAADQGYEDAQKLLDSLTTSEKEKETETEKQTETERQPETDPRTTEELVSEGYQSYQEGRYEDAVESFQIAADRGDAEAQYWLAACYERGDGITEDEEKAVEYYEKAAEQGHAGAQNNLGMAYEWGMGVTQDSEKAVEWYQKAADQGNDVAQYNLAGCYLNGDGVEQNSEKAVEWFEKSAMQGEPLFQCEFGKLYIEGDKVEKDEEKGKAWLQKAADQGWREAQELLDSLAALETKKETETETEGKTKHQESVEASSEAESEKQLKYVVTECEDEEASYTYMYADPNSKKEVVLKLQKNSVVDVLDAKMIEDEIWAYTRYFGCSGWVNGKFLKRVGNMDSDNYGVGRYYISAEETSLRSEPDGTGEEIVTFKYGAIIQVKSMENGWAYVNFRPQPEYITGNGGGAGYIDATCISKNVLGSYVVNTEEDTGVGLRRTPRIEENNKIGNVPGGTNIKISAIQNGWGKTEYDGTEGWIMLKYLYLDKKDVASNESEQENADEQETYDILMNLKEETEKQTETDPRTTEELVSEGYQNYQDGKYEEAVANFQIAADRGDAEAQYWLAACYEDGNGVTEDGKKAVEYYEKAAEQGHAGAQNNLGFAYLLGIGGEQDSSKAVEWYRKAAEQGSDVAQYNLAWCYLSGDGVEQNSEKAAEWFEKAAMQGDPYEQYNLGKMYIEGDELEKDEEKGKAWLQKAADQGYEDAQKLLNSLAASE